MKFVALLSGGKDSCFNISHCQKHGHELVAAASLRPKEGIDELDSYLYQTVGQDAIEYVAQALDVPLYRTVIQGTAVELQNEYGTRLGVERSTNQGVDEDETEDMFRLLQDVLRHHPDIQAVSVGAILSTYQRLRVEHVCRRLGLTSLSYLWQRDQEELLQEMIDAGVHAVLIKVAGIGLKPLHLGQSLAEMQPLLQSLNLRFGSHVCGEGGEYESLTLDCPAFKRKIILTETETVIQNDHDFATVAYLRIKSAHLEDKASIITDIIPPILFDEEVTNVQAAAQSTPADEAVATKECSMGNVVRAPTIQAKYKWVAVSSVSGAEEHSNGIAAETRRCFENLKKLLAKEDLDITAVAHITALLGNMDDFAAFNQVYSTMFGTSPPARACVAVDLPRSHSVLLECLAYRNHAPLERLALHVQGISYWAPANIGPYSQAISVGGVTFVSGQIGLIPSSMILPSPYEFATEISLSLKHIRSIIKALQTSSLELQPYGYIVWLQDSQHLSSTVRAMNVWIEISRSSSAPSRVPVLVIIPSSLPKGAAVEAQTVLHRQDSNSEETEKLDYVCQSTTLHRLESTKVEDVDRFTVVWTNLTDIESAIGRCKDALSQALCLKLYTSGNIGANVLDKLNDLSALTVVPVRGVFSLTDSSYKTWEVAIVAMCFDKSRG
ncbi:Diphthine--ammonia ligase; AltName: Full=Diphthamide synthase; AltName: Full=Diphthamide synthetase [Serendipita indica DSM 11827]|nr:Diphthine--ammonia ligase; AltName: Full=Diphthamide synthase; AltName: Full=Diphthamide synthetase [Serendipita indica DSM 11827]